MKTAGEAEPAVLRSIQLDYYATASWEESRSQI